MIAGLPFWVRLIGRLLLLEELAYAYWKHRHRKTSWYWDVWAWYWYQVHNRYPPHELDHWGPLFKAVEHGGRG